MINGKFKNSAAATVWLLAFSAIFSLVLVGLVRFGLSQVKLGEIKSAKQKAHDFAESGLEYYEWFMARFPNGIAQNAGTPHSGNVFEVKDPQSGNTIGKFELTIDERKQCDILQSVSVSSVGYSLARPSVKQIVKGVLAKPSVSRYSYIINTDVWAGASRTIIGPYHSNGGIRMDGTNNSIVTSAKSSWFCDGSFGCSPASEKPGIFGSSPNSNLWKFPVDEKPFVNFASNFSELRNLAQNNGGIFLPRFTGYYGDDRRGYELVFRGDGTVDVYRVNYSGYVWGYRKEYGYTYSWSYGWRRERTRPFWRSYLGRYDVPNECSLIFSEEKLWVSGEVDGKFAVVAARTSGPYKPEIVLRGNITYSGNAGADGVTLIAQSYILIPEYSPNNMELNGIFVAQEGSFGRSYYEGNTRNTLSINGTVVSRARVGTAWGCGSTGYFCSGYKKRINSYDRFLRTDPPPFTPTLTDTMIYVKYTEK